MFRGRRMAPSATGPALPAPYKYWAFISYSHADARWASWLRDAIETYRVPPAIVGRITDRGAVPVRLHPVFQDRDELAGAPDLTTELRDALHHSMFLIVVCSPHSAASTYVGLEIAAFRAAHGSARLLALIVDGDPAAIDGPRACFPAALRTWREGDEEKHGEPLAADVRPGREQKRTVVLKLVAGILGLGFDALKQRDQERQIRRLWIGSAVMAALVLTMAGLAYYARVQQTAAETQRNLAEARRQVSLSRGLAAQARLSAADGFATRALLLATEAVAATGASQAVDPVAEQELRDELVNVGGTAFVPPMPQRFEPGAVPSAAPKTQTGAPKPQDHTRIMAQSDRWVVVQSEDWSLALWRLDGDEASRSTPRWVEPRASWADDDLVTISPDQQWLFVGGLYSAEKKLVSLGETPTTDAVSMVVPPAHEGFDKLESIRFSPDSRWLVLAYWQGPWQLIHLDAGARTFAAKALVVRDGPPPDTGDDLPRGIEFSADSSWLVASPQWLWDLRTPEPIRHAIVPGAKVGLPPFRWLTFLPAGDALVTSGHSAANMLHRLRHGAGIVERVDLAGTEETEEPATVSADGRWLRAATTVWRLGNGPPLRVPATLDLPDGATRARFVTAAGDRQHLLVFGEHSQDEWLRVWTLRADASARPAVSLEQAVVSGSGHWVVGRSGTRTTLFDLNGPDVRATDIATVRAEAVAVAADDSYAIVAQSDGTVTQVSLDGKFVRTPLGRTPGKPTGVELSPGGTWILVTQADGATWLMSARAAMPRVAIRVWQQEGFLAEHGVFAPSDAWLVLPRGSQALLWDLSVTTVSAQPVVLKGHDHDVSYVDFLAGGELLLTSSFFRDDKAEPRMWSLADRGGLELPRLLPRGEQPAHHGAFSPNGQWFVGVGDTSVTLWPLDGRRSRPYVYTSDARVHEKPRFSPNGRWVVISTVDGFGGQLFDLHASPPVRTVLDKAPIAGRVFSPDSAWLVVATNAGADLVDLRAATPTPIRLDGVTREATIVFTAANGLLVIRRVPRERVAPDRMAPDRLVAELRDPRTAAVAPRVLLESPDEPTTDANGRWLTAGDGPIVDLATQRRILIAETVPHPRTYRKVHDDNQTRMTVAFSANGRWAIPLRWMREGYPEFGAKQYWVWQYVFDLESARPATPVFSLPKPQEVVFAEFSATGSRWVVVDRDGTAGTLALTGTRLTMERLTKVPVESGGFLSPDGQLLVTTGSGSVQMTWTTGDTRGSYALPNYRPSGLRTLSGSFTPDGTALFTEASDASASVLVWRVWLPPSRLRPVTIPGRLLDLSSDGKWLAVAGADGVVVHAVGTADLVAYARRVAGRALTERERLDFLVID